MASALRFIIVLFILTGLVAAIYFLWQRQPKAKKEVESPSVQTVLKTEPKQEKSGDKFINLPKPEEVQISTDVKFSGEIENAQKVLIFSDTQNIIIDITEKKYSTNLTIPTGINLFSVVALDKDSHETKKTTVAVYSNRDESKENINFTAGTVTKIFQNATTITTISGEKEVLTNSSTKITLQDTTTAKKSPSPKESDNSIRVGDYIVAVGQSDNNRLKAQKVEVYRTTKPQIETKYEIIKINTSPKNNSFSTVAEKDNNTLTLTIDKNTKVFENNKKAATSSISKGKRAIVFYKDGASAVVSSIYFL